MRRSFTLVELLVVVTILAILAAFLLPALSRAKAVAQKAACMANEKQIGTAALMWSTDNNGFVLPWKYHYKRTAGDGYDEYDGYNWKALEGIGSAVENHVSESNWFYDDCGVLICPTAKAYAVHEKDPGKYYSRGYGINMASFDHHIPWGIPSFGIEGYNTPRLVDAKQSEKTMYVADAMNDRWEPQTNNPQGHVLQIALTDEDPEFENQFYNRKCYSVRHLLQANILFLDGHVRSAKNLYNEHLEEAVIYRIK